MIDFSVIAADGHVVHGSHWPVEAPAGVLLLVHGITGTRHENGYYDLVAQSLQERRVSTFSIDYRGHGESDKSINELMLSGVMLDIEAAWGFSVSTYGDHTVRLISGASFGGGVSLLFGQNNTSVDGIVLTMPVLSYVDDLCRVNPTWQADMKKGFIGYEGRQLSPLLLPELHFFDRLIDATHLRAPVVILHGTADSDVPFQASVDFADSRREHIEVIGLDDMDHGWTAPGDHRRETEESWENQRVAALQTADTVALLVDELKVGH